MSDRPGLPDCMMPDGGEACAYVQWQASTLDQALARVRELEAEVARWKRGYDEFKGLAILASRSATTEDQDDADTTG